MVSEENRRNRYAPRRKKTEEEKIKLRSILEKARKVKGSKIAPLTFKQRLENLENNTTNTNSSNNNDVNNEIIPMLDFLSMRIDDLEDENSSLITKLEELESKSDYTDEIMETMQDEVFKKQDVINVPIADQNNNKLQLEINNMHVKINALESNQEETKKDISEIFSDLNDMEDKLDD